MKTGVLIQARMGSARLPGKMLFPLDGVPLIRRVMIAAKNIKADEYVISCPESDVVVFKVFADMTGFKTIGGSEKNVVERLMKAVKELEIDTIVHITGDKAFLSAKYTQLALDHYLKDSCDLVSYEDSPLKEMTGAIYYPSIMSQALVKGNATPEQLEHVKPLFTDNKDCKWCKMKSPKGLTKIKNFPYTIDTEDDYLNALQTYEKFYPHFPLEPEEIQELFA